MPGMGRFPSWSCGVCGASANWRCRRKCRGCQRDPPKTIRDAQREHMREREAAGKTGGGGGRASGGGGSQHNHGPRSPQGTNRGVGGGPATNSNKGSGKGGGNLGGKGNGTGAKGAYAEAAAKGRDLAAELAELRRANERLVQQVATLQAAKADDEDEDMEEESDADAAAKRDARIRVLESNLRALAEVYTEASPRYLEAKEELESLYRQRRESRPLKSQLVHADRKIEKMRQRAERLLERAKDLQRQRDEAQQELDEVDKELEAARGGLAALEEERKALLLREAQAQQEGSQTLDPATNADAAAAAAATSPGGSEAATWEQLRHFVGARAMAPGVNSELAAQVGTAFQLLQDLVAQTVQPHLQGGAMPAGATAAATAAAPAAAASAGAASSGTACDASAGGAAGHGIPRPSYEPPPSKSLLAIERELALRRQKQRQQDGDPELRPEWSTSGAAHKTTEAKGEGNGRERSPRPVGIHRQLQTQGHDPRSATVESVGAGEDAIAALHMEATPAQAAGPTPPAAQGAEPSGALEQAAVQATHTQPTQQQQQQQRSSPSEVQCGPAAAAAAKAEGAGAVDSDDSEGFQSSSDNEGDAMSVDLETALAGIPEAQRTQVKKLVAQSKKQPKGSRKPRKTDEDGSKLRGVRKPAK